MIVSTIAGCLFVSMRWFTQVTTHDSNKVGIYGAMLKRMMFCIMAVLVSRLVAAIEWDSRERSLVAPVGAAEQKVSFGFTNTGDKPLSITEIIPSCGCTIPVECHKSYAPGERGEVGASVNLDGDQSIRDITLKVYTNGRKENPEILKLSIVIPVDPSRKVRTNDEPVLVQPSFVYWIAGSEPRAQIISLRIKETPPKASITSLTVDNDNYRVELRRPEQNDPLLYQVVITPMDTRRKGEATIVVTTDYLPAGLAPGCLPRSYRLTAAVK
ncbi:MAG: DUF1573 domain-containing protein [Opitutae bacterium]|nr:DUF1573 domain-containing protein [Opitutae bacterium]